MLGSLNPLPFRVGGGPTHASRAYSLIRQAVGTGGSARNDLGIDGLWRRARAKGLAASSSAPRRALLQAWPHLATDFLPSYERLLGLSGLGTEEERRQEVTAAFTRKPSAIFMTLLAELQAIDARFTACDGPPLGTSVTTLPGRACGPLAGATETPAFGGREYSQIPAFSSDSVCYVRFEPGYTTALLPEDEAILEEARRLLRVRLPSWYDFEISYAEPGFELAASLLGYAGLED
jgi:hypothetical protein